MSLTHEEKLEKKRLGERKRQAKRGRPRTREYRNGKPVRVYVSKARKTNFRNRPARGIGWPGWVVPTSLLADVVEQYHAQYLPAEVLPGTERESEQDQWRRDLGRKVASIRKTQLGATYRRIYDITHRNTAVIKADFADAVCLAFGLQIDHDTNLPVLPGCLQSAVELIEARAEALGIELDRKTVKQHATTAFRLSLLILAYPHNTERLQKLAPLDCLRPYNA